MARLPESASKIPNVINEPGPRWEPWEVHTPRARCAPAATTITTRAVYFATNEAIQEEFGKAGYPVAEQHLVVRKTG